MFLFIYFYVTRRLSKKKTRKRMENQGVGNQEGFFKGKSSKQGVERENRKVLPGKNGSNVLGFLPKRLNEFGGSTFGGSTFGGSEHGNDDSYFIESQSSEQLFDSTGPTKVYDPNENTENINPNVPMDDKDDDNDNVPLVEGVDEDFLNGFLDEGKDSVVYNNKMEEKRNYLRKKLDYNKRFYFDANDQLLLNHRSFLKYSQISTFEVGYAWKNRVDRMDKVELLSQLVNEINQIKACCLQLYYRESAVSVSKKRRHHLVEKYIGSGHEKDFNESVEREVKEFVWFLKVYKKRYLDIKDRVVRILGLDEDLIKSIKTYDDVYDYFIYRLDSN